MGRTEYQITYIYKGQTITWELWALTEFEARQVFDIKMRKEKHEMDKIRIIKVRSLTKEERTSW